MKSCKYTPRSWISLGFVFLFLAACSTEYPESCPSNMPIGLLDANEIASDESLPFRFPLDELDIDYSFSHGWFGAGNCPPDEEGCAVIPGWFHAAEDYKRPAGTPVYAMAEGRISFSGPAGGYGWLILIDHPQANLYSLYGHLSPSRWKQESGTDVKRGDLIAYLGNPDENGGSAESPLEPHLHFGIRAGQTADYPPRGEWRYMAGWIRLCPQDLGWLQPSLVITSQEIPPGGYPQPHIPYLVRWGLELMITVLYGACGTGLFIGAVRKKLRFLLIFPGVLLTIAGIVLHNNGMVSTYTLLAIGIILTLGGLYVFLRQLKQK